MLGESHAAPTTTPHHYQATLPGHDSHAVLFIWFEKRPTAHFAHGFESEENSPAGQPRHPAIVYVVPDIHATHTTFSEVNLPSSHVVHEEEPVVDATVPAPHAVQDCALVSFENRPIWHLSLIHI